MSEFLFTGKFFEFPVSNDLPKGAQEIVLSFFIKYI